MHLASRPIFQLGVALLALGTQTLHAQTSCTLTSPEPSTFWLIGAGAGAILLLRRVRSKK
jgi:hypothetical protein